MIPRKLIKAWPGLLVFLLGCAVLAGAYWPAPQQVESLALTSDQLSISGRGAISSTRQVVLKYPQWLRIGEMGHASLEIQPGLEPTLKPVDGTTSGSIEALSRLDLPGVDTLPNDLASTALLPGKLARFEWTLQPTFAGKYAGQAWLYLRFYPGAGQAETQKTISAQPVKVTILNLGGIPLAQLKIAGWTALVLGTFITLGILTFVRSANI